MELKFRALSFSGDWFYGAMNPSKEHDSHVINLATFFANFKVSFRAETLGQFTGLLDVNKKEIYEGDILRWAEQSSNPIGKPIWLVRYDRGSFQIPYSETTVWEVIGNIFENEELLK